MSSQDNKIVHLKSKIFFPTISWRNDWFKHSFDQFSTHIFLVYFYFLQVYYFAIYSLFPYNNFLWGLGHNAFLLLTLMWNQVFWIFKRSLVQGSFYCLKEVLPVVFMQFSKIRWFDFWVFPALVCSLTFLLKVSFLCCFFLNNNILFYFLIN